VGKGKRADVYLEVRKRRGIYFLNETSACDDLIDIYAAYISSLMFNLTLSFYVGNV
jgi:hypothetical protein